MRGYELQRSRQVLRAQERRLASEVIFARRTALALDKEDLLVRANPSEVNAHGNVVQRRLIIAGLRNAGCTPEEIMKAWSVTPEQMTNWTEVKMFDDTGYAADIEKHVLEQLPETPEPDRVVPPELAIAPGWVRAQAERSS
jgi:hypothetical protein